MKTTELISTLSPAFEVRGTSIRNTQTGTQICTIWPENNVPEERLKGESWLAMRERTDPEREAIKVHTEERAASICSFLNSQILFKEIAEKLINYIEANELNLNYGYGKCTSLNDLIQEDKMPEIYTTLKALVETSKPPHNKS